MVRSFFGRIAAPVRGLHQAAYLLAALTFLSQALALLRDHIFAGAFGAGQILDMYYAAFKIPDVVFALVASLVSAYVLIPKITELSQDDARKLLSQTSSFLLIGGGIICGIIAVFAPQILFALYPTFRASAEAASFILLARILLIQPVLLGLSGIITSVSQIQRRFVLFALSPVLYNIGIIFGTIVLYPRFGLPGIGVGVVIGAIAHLSIHLPVISRAGLFPKLVIPSPRAMWQVVKDSVPRSLALGMSSITTVALLSIVSRTETGGIAVFTLASNLSNVPLSLVSSSYVTAAFPVMAEHISHNRVKEYKETISMAGRHIIFWSALITVLAIILRAHIVRIVLGSGAFNWDNTRVTAAVLAILLLSLMAQGIIQLASRAFYAAHRSWNPLIVQLGDAGVSVAVALLMLKLATTYPIIRYFVEALFRVSDVPGTSVLFIALGYTVGQIVMCIVAMVTLRTVAPGIARTFIRPILTGLGSAVIGGAAAYAVLDALGNISPLTSFIAVFTQAAIAGIVGLAVSVALLALLEREDFLILVASLKRLRNSRILAPFATPLENRPEQ